MATGHSTPPFFKRGLPPAARASFYLALCLALLVADLRLNYLGSLREAITVLTYPLRMAATTPADFVRNSTEYFSGLARLQAENKTLKARELDMSSKLLFAEELRRENDNLRGILDVSKRVPLRTSAAQILFPSRDAFSRKVVLDKGSTQGVLPGSAVVDEKGLLGQVTRVYPLHAEVTLLSDKDQAVPVVIERSGLRAVLAGMGTGLLELKFLASNAEVRPGDRILTSGLDGIYAPGIPVATVLQVKRDSGEAFASILCKPIAAVERSGAVLIFTQQGDGPEIPVDDVQAGTRRASSGRIRQRTVSEAFSPAPAAASAPVAAASAPVAAASAPAASSSSSRRAAARASSSRSVSSRSAASSPARSAAAVSSRAASSASASSAP